MNSLPDSQTKDPDPTLPQGASPASPTTRLTEPADPPLAITENKDGTSTAAASLHPLSLLFELAHRIRANLIPAVFASFSAATGGVAGLYIGLSIFGVAIAIAIVRFMTFRYRLTDDHLLVDQGLIFRTHRSVPIDRIQNIDSVQNLFHRLFQVAEVRIETASGNEPEAIMRVISQAEVERLRTHLTRLSTARTLASSSAPKNADHATELDDTGAAHSPSTSVHSAPAPVAETILTIPVSQLIKAGLISNRGQVLASIVVGYFWQAYTRSARLDNLEGVTQQHGVRSWIRETILGAGQATSALDWTWSMGNHLVTACLIVLAVLAVVLILRAFSAIWFVLKFYDYRLVRRGRDFQIQCGLFTKVSASVPGDRIQVICVHRTWLARWFGLAAMRIEASGGSGKEDEDASATVARQWFVPVMPADDLPRVLHALQPLLTTDHQSLNWRPLAPRAYARMIRLPLFVFAIVFVASLIVGVWVDWSYASIPLAVSILGSATTVLLARKRAKSRKFASTEHGFVYRSGLLTHKTSYGFWDRTQTIDVRQSPFDRRWGMASLLLDTAAAGTADHPLAIEYLTADTAREEFEHACKHLLSSHFLSDPPI